MHCCSSLLTRRRCSRACDSVTRFLCRCTTFQWMPPRILSRLLQACIPPLVCRGFHRRRSHCSHMRSVARRLLCRSLHRRRHRCRRCFQFRHRLCRRLPCCLEGTRRRHLLQSRRRRRCPVLAWMCIPQSWCLADRHYLCRCLRRCHMRRHR